MKDNRERRVLDTGDRYNNSMYQNLNNESFNSYGRKKRYNKLKIIFLISFIFSAIFLGFLYIKSLLIFRHRLILTAIVIVFYILVLLIINAKRKTLLKTLSILLMIFLGIGELAFVYLYGIVEVEMKNTNRDNIAVPSEYKKKDSFNVYMSGLDVDGDI